MARRIAKIYIHCTASEWGTVEEVERWHKERGWRTIGYHWLITNIFPTYASYKESVAMPEFDGKLWEGRTLNDDLTLEEHEIGAHVRGENAYSLAVALVMNEVATSKQVDTLIDHCVYLCRKYELSPDMVRGHYEHWKDRGLVPKKSCPNLPMPTVRAQIREKLVSGEVT